MGRRWVFFGVLSFKDTWSFEARQGARGLRNGTVQNGPGVAFTRPTSSALKMFAREACAAVGFEKPIKTLKPRDDAQHTAPFA